MGREDDHYRTLGVPPDASTADIKRAFQVMAKALHPDTNLGNRHERN